jgi:hypothetical protein
MDEYVPLLNLTLTDFKGSWVVNLVLLVGVMFLFTVFPGLSNETSWTLTILSYNVITFVMFHGLWWVGFIYF